MVVVDVFGCAGGLDFAPLRVGTRFCALDTFGMAGAAISALRLGRKKLYGCTARRLRVGTRVGYVI